MQPAVFRIVLFCWLFAVSIQPATAATAINGTVTDHRTGAVMVSFPAGQSAGPQAGDKVEFNTEMQGIVVSAGKGEVSEAGPDFAWIEIKKGKPKLNHQALIHATGKPIVRENEPVASSAADNGWGDNGTQQSNNDNQLLTPILAANQACDFQGAFQLAQQARQQAPNNVWLQQNLPTLQILAQRSINYQQALGNAFNALETKQTNISIDYLKQAMQNASVQCQQDQQVRSLLDVAKQIAQSERDVAIARARQKGGQSAQDSQRYREEIAREKASRVAFAKALHGNLRGLLSATSKSGTPAFSNAQPISEQEMTSNIVQQIEQNNSEILNKWRASQGWQTTPPTNTSSSGW